MALDPRRGTVWKSSINSYIGIMFISSVGLLAGIFIWEAGFGYNPLVNAFENTLYKQNASIELLP